MLATLERKRARAIAASWALGRHWDVKDRRWMREQAQKLYEALCVFRRDMTAAAIQNLHHRAFADSPEVNALYQAGSLAMNTLDDVYSSMQESAASAAFITSAPGEPILTAHGGNPIAANAAFDGGDLIKGILQQSADGLMSIIADGIHEGQSRDQIQDRLMKEAGVDSTIMPDWRARMIAQTEVIRAANTVARQRYAAGGATYMVWISGQAGSCTECAELDGAVVPQGDGDTQFISGRYTAETPPLHPNCRCSIGPATDSDIATASILGQEYLDGDGTPQVITAPSATAAETANAGMPAALVESPLGKLLDTYAKGAATEDMDGGYNAIMQQMAKMPVEEVKAIEHGLGFVNLSGEVTGGLGNAVENAIKTSTSSEFDKMAADAAKYLDAQTAEKTPFEKAVDAYHSAKPGENVDELMKHLGTLNPEDFQSVLNESIKLNGSKEYMGDTIIDAVKAQSPEAKAEAAAAAEAAKGAVDSGLDGKPILQLMLDNPKSWYQIVTDEMNGPDSGAALAAELGLPSHATWLEIAAKFDTLQSEYMKTGKVTIIDEAKPVSDLFKKAADVYNSAVADDAPNAPNPIDVLKEHLLSIPQEDLDSILAEAKDIGGVKAWAIDTIENAIHIVNGEDKVEDKTPAAKPASTALSKIDPGAPLMDQLKALSQEEIRAIQKELGMTETGKLSPIFNGRVKAAINGEAPAAPTAKPGKPLPEGRFKSVIDESKVNALAKVIDPSTRSASATKVKIMKTLSDVLRKDPVFVELAEREKFPRTFSSDPVEAAVSTLISNWASTSGDDSPHSLVMQMAAHAEFGLSKESFAAFNDHLKVSTRNKMEKLYKANGPAYRVFLRAMYDNTQAAFAEAGIKEVSIYRGQALVFGAVPDWANAAFGDKTVRNSQGDIERVPSALTAVANVQFRPMSSFTPDTYQAERFSVMLAEGTKIGKMVFSATVPVERLIGSSVTGYGALNEWEVVVLDTPGEVLVRLQPAY